MPKLTQEQESRLGILNAVMVTPHRDLAKLYPVHKEICDKDPLFYVRLASWYFANGVVKDHKELFVITLCLSNFDGHRDVGLALLRQLPPYQVCRIVDFIHGKYIKNKEFPEGTIVGLPSILGRKVNLPRSMMTEIRRYLRERESNDLWFDTSVLTARKYLKRLYALCHVKPSKRAQKIIFENDPPSDSLISAIKQINRETDPSKQAELVVKNRIPFRLAVTLVSQITPTVLLALIESMSDQEFINNIGLLKKKGAMDHDEIRKIILDRLEKIKNSDKVDALKSMQAVSHAGVDEETAEKLKEIADKQIKSKGVIRRPTAIFIDKSASMEEGISVGKEIAALVSSIIESDLYVYAFDSMAYPITSQGSSLADWEKAMKGIKAHGSTSIASPLVSMMKNNIVVEQIVIITDEEETTSPRFLPTFRSYVEKMNVVPSLYIVRCGCYKCRVITNALLKEGFEVYDFDFDGDYYSLPQIITYLTKPSRLELLEEIMSYPLPERKTA